MTRLDRKILWNPPTMGWGEFPHDRSIQINRLPKYNTGLPRDERSALDWVVLAYRVRRCPENMCFRDGLVSRKGGIRRTYFGVIKRLRIIGLYGPVEAVGLETFGC